MLLALVVCRNVNGGAYGEVLAGHECILGRYPVSESLLRLISAIVSQVHGLCHCHYRRHHFY